MRRISMLWFWITPATCVSSIFVFAFGVSLLSYFLTGQENVDVWTVLKLMEALPDPREFLTASLKMFNLMSNVAKKIRYFTIEEAQGNPVVQALLIVANGVISIIRAFISIIGFLASLIISIILFPIYCVFFTLRTCGAFLTLLNVNTPYDITHLSWDSLFNVNTWLGFFGFKA